MFTIMLILSVIAATYIVQYHEDSTAVANVVIGSFRASFHEQMNKFEHHQLKSTGEVKRIIKSKKYTKSEIQLNPPSWGLDRIDSRQGKDHQYVYPDSAGEGVTAYVFDSGINIEHDDFEGRASYGFDATGEGEVDLDGHGTHVSGILGGKSFGVAKKIKLVAVKVLDKNGEGEDINILHGLQWATRDFRKNRRKAVINMSLGGEFSQVFNDAVAATVKLGIPVVVAAGNDNIDACTESPGSEDLAITVGSTDKYDRKSKFSSYGHCVELSAPGQDIKSTYKGSSRATHTLSGTSMAAPHVSGVVAIYLSEGVHANDIRTKLAEFGTFNAIEQLDESTTNILAFNQIQAQDDVPRRRDGQRRHHPTFPKIPLTPEPKRPIIPRRLRTVL